MLDLKLLRQDVDAVTANLARRGFAFDRAAFVADVTQLGVLMAGAGAMFVLGLVDDIVSLRPYTKLVVEIAVASVFVFFGYGLKWTDWAAVDMMLTMLWIVGLTNALNLLDNMDGLCTGIAIIAGDV